LRHCSIRLPAGRIVARVGPNGAGKTTLLHLAVGLVHATDGGVRLFGWASAKAPDLVLSRVGFLALAVPLYDSFSVADMLQVGRSLNRRWHQSVAELRLRRLHIPLDRRVGRLSGGQRAQVALALALGKKPDLILLDEPLANLDPLVRHEFLGELIEAVSAEPLTVVLSSHLIGDLERVCNYMVLQNGGRVQPSGSLDDLTATHLPGPLGDAPRADHVRRTPTRRVKERPANCGPRLSPIR
jgi:ABC-2 type transport system ATP-binding protein